MKNGYFKTKAGILSAALGLAVAIQGCNKQDEGMAPANANAASSDAVWTGPAPTACKTVDLVAGQHTSVGHVDVGVVTGGVVVTYTVTAPGVFLLETHMDAFKDTDQLKADKKLSGGGATPGKFAFKNSWSLTAHKTSYSEFIPTSYLTSKGLSTCYYIATHAALSNGETAWGGLSRPTSTGVSLDQAKQFPGANWSVYFEFCSSECSTQKDFTYAWEDLRNSGNDADYNDLVVQSHVIKSATELKIQLTATASGASYDHKFKLRIPMTGITGIYATPSLASLPPFSYTNDGTYYYITVFESTKAVLPASPGVPFFANTDPAQTACTPFASREITLTIDSTFPFDINAPYKPYMSVYYLGDALANTTNFYDLDIYGALGGTDTWTSSDGKEYPNGILIPSDWRWPLERVPITVPYPNFKSITDGFDPNWANYLAVPAQTFDKNVCL